MTFNGGSGNPSLVSTNAFWGNRLLATYTSSQVYFQHVDPLGTVRASTNASGSVAGTFVSQPFGDAQTTTQGSDQDPYHYAELDHDSESGLDHAQFRHYNSGHGHWMSPDPTPAAIISAILRA